MVASPHSSKPIIAGSSSTHQRASGIHEPAYTDGAGNNILLRFADPHCFDKHVLMLRFVVCVGTYVGGFYLTFGLSKGNGADATPNDLYWGIGIAGAIASFVITCLVFGVKYLDRATRPPRVGKEMTHWLSWIVFLDIIYHVLNPVNLVDVRKTIYAGNVHVVHEETLEEDEFVLDFTADTGDGFNPTYSVFYAMAKSFVKFLEPTDFKENNIDTTLRRADAVVVGGDIAYPWPRHEDIMGRFVRVVAWAFPRLPDSNNAKRPRMYVMPGNHEWVDGLRNFMKLVLGRQQIGNWDTPVDAPYFALQLPHGWWYFAADTGHDLVQDMDDAQLEYFTHIVNTRTAPSDRFIFSNHIPDWIKNSGHNFKLFEKLARFRKEVLGDRVRLELAGDLHYYRRMSEAADDSYTLHLAPNVVETNKRQLVVAGHGGAFAHPTFAPSIPEARLGHPWDDDAPLYITRTDYPTPRDSKAMLTRGFLRGFSKDHNYGYGHILGALYMCMFFATSLLDYSPDGQSFPRSTKEVFYSHEFLKSAFYSFYFWPAFLYLVIEHLILSTQAAALTSAREIATAIGLWLVHTSAQFSFSIVCKKLVDCLLVAIYLENEANTIDFWSLCVFSTFSNLGIYLCGYMLAPYVTAVYLYFGCTLFGFHYNESFALIEDQEHKGFQRFVFKANGDLDMYSLGIKKTPRQWRESTSQTPEKQGRFEPVDQRDVEVFLIEKVTLKRDGPRNSGAVTAV